MQKRYSNERVAALLEDRRIRESDEEAYRKTMERRLDECTVRLFAILPKHFASVRSTSHSGSRNPGSIPGRGAFLF